jgi:hypothetical protein
MEEFVSEVSKSMHNWGTVVENLKYIFEICVASDSSSPAKLLRRMLDLGLPTQFDLGVGHGRRTSHMDSTKRENFPGVKLLHHHKGTGYARKDDGNQQIARGDHAYSNPRGFGVHGHLKDLRATAYCFRHT